MIWYKTCKDKDFASDFAKLREYKKNRFWRVELQKCSQFKLSWATHEESASSLQLRRTWTLYLVGSSLTATP